MSLCDRCARCAHATNNRIVCDGKVTRPRTLCTDFARKEKDKVKR
jgi:hypothetical protein